MKDLLTKALEPSNLTDDELSLIGDGADIIEAVLGRRIEISTEEDVRRARARRGIKMPYARRISTKRRQELVAMACAGKLRLSSLPIPEYLDVAEDQELMGEILEAWGL